MDYGFAPGATPYDRMARLLLTRRPNTSVIHQQGIQDVEAFIDYLNNADLGIDQWVDDFLIVSHGYSSGFMSIDLDNSSLNPDGTPATQTTYEVLEQAVANNSVEIPAALHNQPIPILFDVHISGCLIGEAAPFVQKLKDAFVRPRVVTAPLHFHTATGIGTRATITMYGSFEFLYYSFVLTRPNRRHPAPARFTTKAEAVNAFDNHRFTFIPPQSGGPPAPVPRAIWQRVIPQNLREGFTRPWTNLGQNVGRGISRYRIKHKFWNQVQRFPFSIRLAANPGDRAAREARLRAYITAHPKFQPPPGQPFPFYQRLGYDNVNDFLNGYAWVTNWDGSNNILRCVGSRRVYTVLVPVVEPETLHLFFNLFPVANFGLVQVTNLPRNDARLFLSV